MDISDANVTWGTAVGRFSATMVRFAFAWAATTAVSANTSPPAMWSAWSWLYTRYRTGWAKRFLISSLSQRAASALIGSVAITPAGVTANTRSEEHTSELQSPCNLV